MVTLVTTPPETVAVPAAPEPPPPVKVTVGIAVVEYSIVCYTAAGNGDDRRGRRAAGGRGEDDRRGRRIAAAARGDVDGLDGAQVVAGEIHAGCGTCHRGIGQEIGAARAGSGR